MADQGKVNITLTSASAVGTLGLAIGPADLVTSTTAYVVGVSADTCGAGEKLPVQIAGTCLIAASDAISAGAGLVATTGGQWVTATTGEEPYVRAIALEAASAQGELIKAVLV